METVNSNIKRLVATDQKYHKAPVYIIPKEDPKTRKTFDYVSRLPEHLRKDVAVSLESKRDRDDNVIDELTIRAYHLQVFDLNNANDALFFEIIKDDSMIAPSKSAINPDQHRFYIEDKEKEATAKISKSRIKGKAFAIIENLSLEQQTNYARILGKFTKDLTRTQVEGVLFDVAEETPQLILDVDSDKDLKHKIFLRRCLERNILHMDNGKYMNAKEMVGINEEYAIMWLKDPNNSMVVTQWGNMLEDRVVHTPRLEQMTVPVADVQHNEQEAPRQYVSENETFDKGSPAEDNQGANVENNTNEEVTE